MTATDGSDQAMARAAAPEIALAKKGQLDVYAKCFHDPGPTTFAEVYIRTSAARAVFTSISAFGGNNLDGGGGHSTGDFLNPGTAEVDRRMVSASVPDASALMRGAEQAEFHAFAPDGTSLSGHAPAAVKQGNLMEGNGIYGSGNVCLFGGFEIG